jgi:predicted HTH transcriptional regulator
LRILSEPLETITADDIRQLCADQVAEGVEFELKVDLPHKDGLGKDTWYTGGGIGDRARNEIADEIVAFANTTGGVLCLGITETAEHPKRAEAIRPLPRVHELGRRLRQAVYSVIEPPLPLLEVRGVETEADGSGVVLLRVPPSRRRPHRQMLNRDVFVRRADETARLSMREVQELTIQAVSEATRIDAVIKERRTQFRVELDDWLRKNRKGGDPLWGGGLQLLAIPTTSVDLGRVAELGATFECLEAKPESDHK